MQNKFNPNGKILWEGLSPLTGDPIVCIITGLKTSSSNEKTGDMLQTVILRTDIEPHIGHKNGMNRAICGDCPHAGYNNGSCYVKWFQMPLSIYRAYKKGRYDYFKKSDLKLLVGRSLRMGSAGDPSMVPFSVWEPLLNTVKTHTGYSHQYRHNFAIDFKNVLQASCDTFEDYLYASDLGFNCFLVKHKDTKAPKGFINCPASIEAGKKTSCELCSMCSGSGSKRGKNIYINAHGNTAKYVPVIA